MNSHMRIRFSALAGLVCLLALFCLPAHAEEAKDLSRRGTITNASDNYFFEALFDKDKEHYAALANGTHFTLGDEGGIGSIYVIFSAEYGAFTLTNEDTGESKVVDSAGRLHYYVDVAEVFGIVPKALTVTIDSGEARVIELSVFGPGEVPNWVQKWDVPCEKADLLLLSTHGDDEQLFFAGILPYYAGELGMDVQVVFFSNHWNVGIERMHETLNGLWAVGVTRYPVFGTFGDFYSENMNVSYQGYYGRGITDEELVGFVMEQLRRFKPEVVVGHDINGEYGHGMHMLYTDLLRRALEISNDPNEFPELAEKYGVWDVPKAYLHLYEENQIVMDWDQPLSHFDGMTAFQVTRDLGFPCYVSQVENYSWYYWNADTAANVARYSPREYGLYRTTVGEDVQKNDFFENITNTSNYQKPVELPTEPPTEVPTEVSTEVPAEAPTEALTEAPTEVLTQAPTISQIEETAEEGLFTIPSEEPAPTQPVDLTRSAPDVSAAETNWIILPAAGAVILVIFTAILSIPRRKQKF